MPSNTVKVELIDIDIIDPRAPLTWSSDQQMRSGLLEEATQWLEAHPNRMKGKYKTSSYRLGDEPKIIVIREIYWRIVGVIKTSDPDSPQAVEYETVRQQLKNEPRIPKALKEECEAVFEEAWCEVASDLLARFTKYTPDDD